MKKHLTILLSFFLITTGVIQAQRDMKAFQHISLGLEVGTTGIGLDLAVPLNPYLAVRAGVATFPFNYTTDYNIDFDKQKMDELVSSSPEIKQALQAKNLPTNSSELDSKVDLKAKLGLLNGKVLLDIYPFRKSCFYLTTGVFIGKTKLIRVDGTIPGQMVEVANVLNQYLPTDQQISTAIIIGDYSIQANDLGEVDAAIKINGVKPYLGFGFGRSVPRKRIGFQFELGAMFHGKPRIVSSNNDVREALNQELESNGFTEVMEKIRVYPVLSFRLCGRLF